MSFKKVIAENRQMFGLSKAWFAVIAVWALITAIVIITSLVILVLVAFKIMGREWIILAGFMAVGSGFSWGGAIICGYKRLRRRLLYDQSLVDNQ